jgi:hypothetical protein
MLKPNMVTTQKQLRAAFWEAYPNLDYQAREDHTRSKSQNYQSAEVRYAWCDWIDGLERDGQISQALAERAAL